MAVSVSLTPVAAERLARDREGIVVAGWYYGTPKSGAEVHANPVGLIDLATVHATVGPEAGNVRLNPATTQALGWIQGPAMLNVNVFSRA